MELAQNPWLLWGLSALALVALGLVGCLFLFSVTNAENVRVQRKLESEKQELTRELESFRDSLASLRAVVQEAELQPSMATAAAASTASGTSPGGSVTTMNNQKRGQALRMYRHGESSEKIAAALQLPRGEVDLLLKVEDTLSRLDRQI